MVANPRAHGILGEIVQLQILLQLVGFRVNFRNFVRGKRGMADIVNALFYNGNYAGIMVTVKIGKHTVEMHDAIEELPVVRFHKYQKLLFIDAGIGADIVAFDQRTEKMRRYLMDNKIDNAIRELENLRQSVFLVQNEISPRNRAFAALVTKIDGREYNDLSDVGLQEITDTLNDVPENELTAQLDAVKKKIDEELKLYFPAVFADSEIKEYYDLLKKRTMAVLQNIVAGVDEPDKTTEVEKLTTALITYSNPKSFRGSESAEIQFDRQFENLCLVLSEQLHVKPKDYTVLEFYNAFDFVQERARQAERANKRANKPR